MPTQPKIKVKVKARPPIPKGAAKPTIQEEPIPKQQNRKKGLIRKIVEIVSNDIRHLPDRIWGERKKVTMLKSNESWKDWEDQI